MYRTKIDATLLAVFALGFLAACGDQGSTGDSGTGTKTVSMGKVSAVGNGTLSLNGVSYDTTAATVTMDGSSSSADDLQVGMVVTVTGTTDDSGASGTASSIDYSDELEGVVEMIDLASQTLVVLGQTLQVTADTRFEHTTDLSTLALGNIVEVSGFANADGMIQATYIELKATEFIPGQDEIEVKGTVSSLDEAARTFMIGSLIVDYSTAVLDDGLTLSNGASVEVKSTAGYNDSGALIASIVEPEDDDLGHDEDIGEDSEVEIEGFVTDATATSEYDFKVNGQPIKLSDTTEFEDGTAADIRLNVRLEVEGTLDANGILQAREVDFEDDSFEDDLNDDSDGDNDNSGPGSNSGPGGGDDSP
jgi:hypothetical protein